MLHSHKWHAELKEWVKKTPAEIKQERLGRQAARRKKIKEKDQREKKKEEKGKATQKGDEKAEENREGDKTKQGPEEKVHDDQGIKELDKEPVKAKRSAKLEPDPDPEPALEKETSGLKHLRRRRLEEIKQEHLDSDTSLHTHFHRLVTTSHAAQRP